MNTKTQDQRSNTSVFTETDPAFRTKCQYDGCRVFIVYEAVVPPVKHDSSDDIFHAATVQKLVCADSDNCFNALSKLSRCIYPLGAVEVNAWQRALRAFGPFVK